MSWIGAFIATISMSIFIVFVITYSRMQSLRKRVEWKHCEGTEADRIYSVTLDYFIRTKSDAILEE